MTYVITQQNMINFPKFMDTLKSVLTLSERQYIPPPTSLKRLFVRIRPMWTIRHITEDYLSEEDKILTNYRTLFSNPKTLILLEMDWDM